MTLFFISYNTDLVFLVVIPAMKNVCATAGLMKMATLPEINMEYWMEYRDLILVNMNVTTIDLMGLIFIIVANQNPAPEENLDQRAAPKNIAPEQKGCTTLLKDPANECPSCASVILLPQNLSNLPV
ncbi:hypothetical protein DSO57_1037352 [Entomophthora muscae]|uniref:Uncharacterized protein n=1 Tax=Entomophthora muscae TaxID=34485 RepID=A0ACC2TL32_9FUNG|nr:hypothetical protein DSO57_1037352 [Entomophthora muscae]